MALIGSRALQRNTRDVLDAVERGETQVIMRHGRPVAALVPIDEQEAQQLVLTTSPEFTERRRQLAAEPQRPGTPFATSVREIDDGETADGEGAAGAGETSAAAGEPGGDRAERSLGQIVEVLLAEQSESVRALAEIVETRNATLSALLAAGSETTDPARTIAAELVQVHVSSEPRRQRG